MGNCCSDFAGGKSAVGGTGSFQANQANAPNGAIDAFLNYRGYSGLFSQIELSLYATDLRDRDMLSKSDPMAVVYTKGKDGSLHELGRTEVILNSLNPKWIRKFNVTYQFETVQNLVFHLYDVDSQFHTLDVKVWVIRRKICITPNSKVHFFTSTKSTSLVQMLKLEEQQFLGEAACTLSEVVTKPNRSLTLAIGHTREPAGSATHTQKSGQLTVYAEETFASKTTTELLLRCSDLESRDLFSKSDPFLLISKITESATVPVCKTEVLKNDHNPRWKPITLSMQQAGSKDSPLVIECLNFNANGKHDSLGRIQKSLAELERMHFSGTGINLLPTASGQHHQNKVLKSKLFVDKLAEKTQHTFLDYLTGGYELNFMVAIDFTASNGNPRLPDSLHYIDPSGKSNAYQRAILEAGEVLQFYDSDKRFPAWGFGARPIDAPVSHCFNLNGSRNYCEVEGIHGIMTAYISALQNVSLAGPTLFEPVITAASNIASQAAASEQRKYFVLLIITDGVITDLQETKDAIVTASDLPLSLLIVGVGGADFKEMEVLDADRGEKLQSYTGRIASRDIVQFVPFRDVQHEEVSVVQSLLAELPSQFLTYMRARNLYPTN